LLPAAIRLAINRKENILLGESFSIHGGCYKNNYSISIGYVIFFIGTSLAGITVCV
jgi:hypothetical protein